MDKTPETVLLIISIIACAPFSYLLLLELATICRDVVYDLNRPEGGAHMLENRNAKLALIHLAKKNAPG
jgi:hypothetical protein